MKKYMMIVILLFIVGCSSNDLKDLELTGDDDKDLDIIVEEAMDTLDEFMNILAPIHDDMVDVAMKNPSSKELENVEIPDEAIEKRERIEALHNAWKDLDVSETNRLRYSYAEEIIIHAHDMTYLLENTLKEPLNHENDIPLKRFANEINGMYNSYHRGY